MSAPGVLVPASAAEAPLIDWRAIIAGAVVAAGISFTLIAFGSAIGLSVASTAPTWRDSSAWLWALSGLYMVFVALCSFGFGGYVAFSVYLPSYLKIAYGLPPADAANRMAGFVVVAVVMRPVGGWLSDRLGSIRVLAVCFGVVTIGSAVASFTPLLEHAGTAAFLGMAAALGAGSGATFALIAAATDPGRVGGVTGLVGAAGGLGGFFPPLILGATYDEAAHSYTIGLGLLVAFAAAACLFTIFGIPRDANKIEMDAPVVRR